MGNHKNETQDADETSPAVTPWLFWGSLALVTMCIGMTFFLWRTTVAIGASPEDFPPINFDAGVFASLLAAVAFCVFLCFIPDEHRYPFISLVLAIILCSWMGYYLVSIPFRLIGPHFGVQDMPGKVGVIGLIGAGSGCIYAAYCNMLHYWEREDTQSKHHPYSWRVIVQNYVSYGLAMIVVPPAVLIIGAIVFQVAPLVLAAMGSR